MHQKEWEEFFDLLNKVVENPVGSVNEKIAAVKQAAEEYGESAEFALEEFTAWNFGY